MYLKKGETMRTANKDWTRKYFLMGIVAGLCFILSACGGDPFRYDPGTAATPNSVTAKAGDGKVILSWATASNAGTYTVYYATEPGVEKKTASKITGIASTSYIVSGLENGTKYYLAVAGANSNGESGLSQEVSATPTQSGAYSQEDLEGTWNFNALVGKPDARWMRGTVTIDAGGAVAYTSFLDSSGGTTAPSELLTTLAIDATGTVIQAAGPFHGILSTGKTLLAATSALKSGAPLLLVLQKRVPGVTYSNADIAGTGSTPPGTGPLPLAYQQISVGSKEEWEYAVGQAGKDRQIKYSVFLSPSGATRPGDKASLLSITSDGIVTESPTGVLPAPTVVLPYATMSSDKTLIVGTATDTSGGSPCYVLRLVQITQLPGIPLIDYLLSDLAGDYGLLRIVTSPMWAYGTLSMNASGLSSFSSYADSSGGSTLPADDTFTMSGNGALSSASDTTVHGTLSYFKDLVVMTRTESGGKSSLSILLKR
jgi:hypothetical protein